MSRVPIGGRSITHYLIRRLQQSGYAVHRSADYHAMDKIKEDSCYIGNHITTVERKLADETTTLIKHYQLPDGRMIKMERERYEAPEILFNPHLYDLDTMGWCSPIGQSIHQSMVTIYMYAMGMIYMMYK